MKNTSINTNDLPLGFDITEVHHLVKEGKKIEAIKRVHDAAGWGLRASKEYVDKISEGIDTAGTVFYESKQTTNIPVDLGPVKELLNKGLKVEAIKALRDLLGLGLKDAHDFAEQLANGTVDRLARKRELPEDSGIWKNEPAYKASYSKTTVNGKEVKPGDPEWEKVADLFSELHDKDIDNGDALSKVLDTFLDKGTNAGSVKNASGSFTVTKKHSAAPDPVPVAEPVWEPTPVEQKLKRNGFVYDKGTKGGSSIGLYIVIALIIAGIVIYLLNAIRW